MLKLFYAARIARYDLLHAIGRLAALVTRWDPHCDRMLHRLVCYVDSSPPLGLVGWVSDAKEEISQHLYADADFAWL